MASEAMGPSYAGGAQPIVKGGYSALYLPDARNNQLQAEGQAAVFYYVPNTIRMARKDGPDSGDFLFNLVRFSGADSDGVIGGGGEVAGGVLTFSVTGAMPEPIRRQAEDEITARFTGSPDPFWGIRGNKPPMFRPAIITANTTTVSNVSPTPRGLPALRTATRSGRSINEFAYYGMPGSRSDARPMPSLARDETEGPAAAPASSNLDPWYWQMHGNGAGSIDPTGTHAFSGLIGAYPAAICYEAFHGTSSPLIVIQNLKLKVWSPVVTLDIVGDWDRVFEHFSAAASGRFLWASVDLKAEFNKMRQNGTIKVDLKVDTTLPGADEIAKRLDQKSDLVYEKFMEAAKSVIFEQAQPQVEAAQASSSGGGIFSPWGVGVALKYRRDTTNLHLEFHQTQQFAYLQDHTISSSLSGMYDEIRKDPEAERKYFLSVYLDDWPRKLARVVRPVAAWEDKTVEFLSVQVGYPNTKGEINWSGQSFTDGTGEDGTWKYQTAQKPAADVTDPPEGWKPDLTFVKRKVHLAEPPSEAADPYTRVQIERNTIDLDPEPNGSLINDTTLEVRADSAGRLSVGPIELGVILTDKTQMIEVVFEAIEPESGQPAGMAQVRFRWDQDDYDNDRRWMVYTGDPKFLPFYRYQVIVTVKGTLFEPGRSWEGPWVRSSGNGPLIVNVPRPDTPGVVTRTIPEDLSARTRGPAASTTAPAREIAPTPEPTAAHAPEPVTASAAPRKDGSTAANGRQYLAYQL